jgi:hypothetical protein
MITDIEETAVVRKTRDGHYEIKVKIIDIDAKNDSSLVKIHYQRNRVKRTEPFWVKYGLRSYLKIGGAYLLKGEIINGGKTLESVTPA